MGWIASLGIALVTGIAAMFGAGTVAGLVVDWHNVSSFEGGAGFFVIGLALIGGFAGFVIGLVVSRLEARQTKPRFVTALGASAGVVAFLLALATGASWWLADIPPQIDGEELFLLTEIRWPASGAVAPAAIDGVPYLRFGALRGSVVRKLESGPLFVDQARQEDGRWIVPGAVPIFTSRGGRLLDLNAGDHSIVGFMVPLPAYPRNDQRQWSEWLPHARDGQPALPDQFTFRYKVIRRSEPVRTETIGAFEIDTVANYFYNLTGTDRLAAHATFRVRYKGEPVPLVANANTVAVIGGPTPALLATTSEHGPNGGCVLLIDIGSALDVRPVNACGAPVTERLLTSDQARFTAAKRNEHLAGWIDRTSFAEPGLFQLDAAILDTRSLTSSDFLFPSESRPNTSIPVLGLSPDERSFVWFAQGSDKTPQLGVTDWRDSRSYLLPIDRRRMRFNTESALDPDWVRHHFEWQLGAEGHDVLVERTNFIPLPYHGDLSLAGAGGYHSYTLRPGSAPLRDAIVDLLVRDLGAERLPDEPAGFARVRVRGTLLGISAIGSPSYVYLSMDDPDSDPQVMSAIAASIDAALATGRYDDLFISDEAP